MFGYLAAQNLRQKAEKLPIAAWQRFEHKVRHAGRDIERSPTTG